MRALPAVVASVFLSACFNSNDPPPEPPEVTAIITNVVLAGDCGGGPTGGGGGDSGGEDRYAGPGADEAPGAPCLPEYGCMICQQSFMTITFEAGEGNTGVDVSVDGVRMHDVATGAEVDTLGAYLPQRFLDGGGVRSWDGRIRPFELVNTSYQLSAPDWATIGGGDEMTTYAMTFRVAVDVAVDGAPALTAQSGDVARLPPP